MTTLDAILFDIGGTLDGRGGWRDRFHRLFTAIRVDCSHAQRVSAFDFAEARSHATPDMEHMRLREMVTRHVGWQLESLGIEDHAVARGLADRFVHDVEGAAAVNRRVLARLVEQGFRLGVVSNACGNAVLLCEQYGYAGMLSAIVDSRKFGAAKPDPAIFRHALALLGVPPERTGFVGDSLDRDIVPAKSLGMRTFWVTDREMPSPPPAADVLLKSLAELPASLLQLDLRTV